MHAPTEIPPLLTQADQAAASAASKRKQRLTNSSLFALAVLAAIAAAKLSTVFSFAWPRCSFKMLTGHPCAFCGGTRALRSIAGFHWHDAFWFNPLVTIAAASALPLFLFWNFAPQSALLPAKQKLHALPWGFIAVIIVLLNWAFVLRYLPR